MIYNFIVTTRSKIGEDFTALSLAKFALPSFFTNLLSQLFKSLDDGLFVSRYVGEKALASLNLINPLAGIQLGMEHLFSLGASNISARLMGEGDSPEARRVFTRVVISGFVVSLLFGLGINIFMEPILRFLGADDELFYYATYQIRIVYGTAPLSMLNTIFSCYFATAGKPKMGMYCSIINGAVNIGLDLILIVFMKMGVLGAAIATAAGQLAVFVVGLLFFMNINNEIYFVKPNGNFISSTLESAKFALPQCINSASFGVTAYISNMMILSIIGSTGIATNAIVSDIRKIVSSGLIGFAVCVGPVISYNCGSKEVKKLKRILTHVLKIWLIGSAIMTTCGLLLRKPLIQIFMSDETSPSFYDMTFYALTIELMATPFVSGCITINRGLIALGEAKSAIVLSTFRNLIIKAIVFVALPKIFGADGIWFSFPLCEFLAFCLGTYLVIRNADNYGYGRLGVARKIIME